MARPGPAAVLFGLVTGASSGPSWTTGGHRRRRRGTRGDQGGRDVEADRAASVASALASAATGVIRLLVVAALRLTGVLSAMPPLPALAWAGVGLGLGWWLHRRGGGAWIRFALTGAALAVRGRPPHRLLAFLAYAETVGLLRDGAEATGSGTDGCEPTRRRFGERPTGQPTA